MYLEQGLVKQLFSIISVMDGFTDIINRKSRGRGLLYLKLDTSKTSEKLETYAGLEAHQKKNELNLLAV